MDYRPPAFRQPQQFSGSLDGIFEQYERMKAEKEQAGRQDFADTVQYGTPLRGLTPEQLQRGAQGPTMTPAVPAYEPNNMVEMGRPAQSAREQFDNDPHVAAIQRFIQTKKQGASMASTGAQTDIDLKRSQIRENNAQADALGQDQIYVDPTNGKQIKIPKGAKLLPPTAKQEGRILPANAVLALNEGKAVARILPEVEQAIKENESMFGPVGGRLQGMNPYDEKAQTVDARMRTASQAFGRFMEGGVLRKEDEEKYRKMFPQLSDIPGVAKNKLSIVRRQLAQKYQDDKGALGGSGYDIAGFGDLEIPASLFGEAAPESGPAPIALTGAKAARLAELRARAGR